MAKLTCTHESRDIELELDRASLTIGRGDTASLQLMTATMSREHVRVFKQDGRIWVEDLGSSNGTIMGGQTIAGPTQLRHGESFLAGGIAFKLEAPELADNKVQLTLSAGDGEGERQFTLVDYLSVGRGEESDIVIAESAVSGSHCSFQLSGSRCTLTDLGSSNGTWVGSEEVHGTIDIFDGDVVTLAQVARLHVSFPGQQAPTTLSQTRRAPIALKSHSQSMDVIASAPAPMGISLIIIAIIAVVLFVAAYAVPPMLVAQGSDVEVESFSGSTPALSFEASEGVGGWEVRGITTSVKHALDARRCRDGEGALYVEGSAGLPGFEAHTLQEVPLSLREGTIEFHLRAPKTTGLIVTAGYLNNQDIGVPLGSVELPEIGYEEWSKVSFGLKAPYRLTSERLWLRFEGGFSLLWIDKIEVTPGEAARSRDSFEFGKIAMVRKREAGISVFGNPTLQIDAIPLRKGEEPDNFTPSPAEVTPTAFTALWTGSSSTGDVQLVLEAEKTKYDPEGDEGSDGGPLGARVTFTDVSTGSPSPANMVLRIEGSLSDTQWVDLVDYTLMPTPVTKATDKRVGTIMLIRFGEHTLYFPEGVAVKVNSFLDVGLVELLVSDPRKDRKRIAFEVYSTDLLLREHAKRLLAQAELLIEASQMSAALQRVKAVLKMQLDSASAKLKGRARSMEEDILSAGNAKWKTANDALENALEADADLEAVQKAFQEFRSFLQQFPADDRAEEAEEQLKGLNDSVAAMGGSVEGGGPSAEGVIPGLRERRPLAPTTDAVLRKAEANAAGMLNLAKTHFSQRKYAAAYVFADNVRWNLHYTSHASEAQRLVELIEEQWQAGGSIGRERERFIALRIEEAESRAIMGSTELAIQLLEEVLARYPRCDEAADIKARLHGLRKALVAE